jgi:hypothetical protein
LIAASSGISIHAAVGSFILAGALIVLTETRDAGKREAWARRGAAFFQGRSRRTAPAAERHIGGARAQPGGVQSSTGSKGAA